MYVPIAAHVRVRVDLRRLAKRAMSTGLILMCVKAAGLARVSVHLERFPKRKRLKGQRQLCLFIVALVTGPLLAQEPEMPVISQWWRGTVYYQYRKQTDDLGQRLAKNTPEQLAEALSFFSYTVNDKDGVDFFMLAAPTSIEALATINRLPHPVVDKIVSTVLLPTVPGIFIPENPISDLEMLIASTRTGTGVPVTINGKAFSFIPGARFTANEYTFFLDVNNDFSFPLKNYRISSDFGPRINPVTGAFRVHEGLDLAAPTGTEVFATRSGTVAEIGSNAVYGNYIIIRHSDGWSSLYGHLSKIEITAQSTVQSGMLIGRVGSTGQSTGPHLHFELRKNGTAQNPGSYLDFKGAK
jgi:murein DD-endopeptidase MepM/ murein hydrolase activator NlpD